jgi:Melibiase
VRRARPFYAGPTAIDTVFMAFAFKILSARRAESWPSKVPPVLLNTWEASYFNVSHDIEMDIAVTVGIEVLVLDDGWFGNRNNTFSGLGDWYRNLAKLPWASRGLLRRDLLPGEPNGSANDTLRAEGVVVPVPDPVPGRADEAVVGVPEEGPVVFAPGSRAFCSVPPLRSRLRSPPLLRSMCQRRKDAFSRRRDLSKTSILLPDDACFSRVKTRQLSDRLYTLCTMVLISCKPSLSASVAVPRGSIGPGTWAPVR